MFDLTRVKELERELERWRHGKQIEGDYVCPYQLMVTNLTDERDALAAQVDQLQKELDDDVVPRVEAVTAIHREIEAQQQARIAELAEALRRLVDDHCSAEPEGKRCAAFCANAYRLLAHPDTQRALAKGLQQSAHGDVHDLGSFAAYAEDGPSEAEVQAWRQLEAAARENARHVLRTEDMRDRLAEALAALDKVREGKS